MEKGTLKDPSIARFAPRVTVLIVAGLIFFLISSLVYVLPVLLESAPPGAIADYTKERVAERMEGKAMWFLTGSLLFALFLGMRGWLPGGTRRGER